MNGSPPSRIYAETRTDNFVFSPVRGRNRAKSSELVPGDRAGISMGMKDVNLILSEIQFCGWLGQAAPGDSIEYHKGYLVLDVCLFGRGLKDAERLELGRLARRAWLVSERGLVHLVQRRLGPSEFSYLAIARARPRTLPAALSSLLVMEAA